MNLIDWAHLCIDVPSRYAEPGIARKIQFEEADQELV